ncbi:MAG: M23/M56 family metallopeptidase, partial [Bacteroidota bacterium]
DPMILDHELVHIRERHTIDVLLMELLVIFQWYNPLIYLFRYELRANHEFIADQKVANRFGLVNYARLLVAQATQGPNPALALPFAQITKQRLINMKTKTQNPWSRFRFFLVLPIACALIAVFALKTIEREKAVPVPSDAPLTIEWGDLQCNCYGWMSEGNYTCDLVSIDLEDAKMLQSSQPSFLLHESGGKEIIPKSYTVTVSEGNNESGGSPVFVADHDKFFQEEEKLWALLTTGTKMKFRAVLQNDKEIEFRIGMNGLPPGYIANAFLSFQSQEGKEEVIPYDNISLNSEVELTKVEFSKLMKNDFQLFINKKAEKIGFLNLVKWNEKDKVYLTTHLNPEAKRINIAHRPFLDLVNDGDIFNIRLAIKGGKSFYTKFIIKEKNFTQINYKFEIGGLSTDHHILKIPGERIDQLYSASPTLQINGRDIDLKDAKFYFIKNIFNESLRENPFKSGYREYSYTEFKDIMKYRLEYLKKIQVGDVRLNKVYYTKDNVRDMAFFDPYPTFAIIAPNEAPIYVTTLLKEEERHLYTPYQWRRPFTRSKPNFAYPLKGGENIRITSQFGSRTKPLLKNKDMHLGLDFGAPEGTIVHAVTIGEVIEVIYDKKGYGKKIVIEHPDGFQSVYAHLQSYSVKVGDQVGHLRHIGTVGNTGKSSGPHLHFELLKDGKHVDPL